jgi:hypothetical protein
MERVLGHSYGKVVFGLMATCYHLKDVRSSTQDHIYPHLQQSIYRHIASSAAGSSTEIISGAASNSNDGGCGSSLGISLAVELS